MPYLYVLHSFPGMLHVARTFRSVLRIKKFKKYYFGFYKRLFKPYHLFKGLTTITSFDDTLKMKVDLDEWIQQNIFFFGIYDPININFLKKFLGKDDVFIDVGANVGSFTLVASKMVGKTGVVFAFEPVDIVADRLNYNLQINRIENVVLVRKALYHKSSELDFYLASKENLGMSSIKRHDTESGIIKKIPAISLDNYLKDKSLKSIRLIKIDIEGAEIYALEGMKEVIKKYQPAMMIEVSPQVLHLEKDRNKIFDFFEQMAYKPFILNDESNITPPHQAA